MNAWNYFPADVSVLSVHKTSTPAAAQSALPLNAEKGHKHLIDKHTLWVQTCLPFSVFPTTTICVAYTLNLMSKPHWESRVRFTLPSKINDTSNIADGCNQIFKQQAASLSPSLFLSCNCQGELKQCALCKARLVHLIILSPFNL